MIIYKNYTQETLDQQYNNRYNVPDHERHLKDWEELGKEAGATIPFVKNIAYGDLSRETLDIFPAEKPNAKVMVFIHGGYWYKNTAADFYMIAKAFRNYHVTTVLVNYPLMPEYPMEQLVHSCSKAISWVYKNIAAYEGDPDQIYVSGHSAGGHLAAMMLTTNWSSFHLEMGNDTLKGVFAISGLYNLLPVQKCYVNDVLQMDEASAFRNSPVNLSAYSKCPLFLAYGGVETAEYREQSKELFQRWNTDGNNRQLLEINGTDHFSILATMLDAQSVLHRKILQMMHIL